MAQIVIGLTGGIGSGKTAVSDLFAALGATIADSDVVARKVVEPGMPAYIAIIERFGEDILLEDGGINRAKLRRIIFAREEERYWLEQQTHGPIMQMLGDIIARSRSPYSILVLSAGSGRSPLINRMLVVDIPRSMQLSRVSRRDRISIEQIEAIIKSQPTREQRLTWADDVIVNDGSLEELKTAVQKLHNQYVNLSEAVI